MEKVVTWYDGYRFEEYAEKTVSVNYQITAARALHAGDVEKFVKTLRNFFANIPYSLTDRQNEQMWQTIVDVRQG